MYGARLIQNESADNSNNKHSVSCFLGVPGHKVTKLSEFRSIQVVKKNENDDADIR